ncbi:serpentine type 7TM GPCR chemoreceptor srsx domain-containing protein [Ditylenchus destructor]|uniref:Serpentine type 7TM GPCR chemoreceptor srsx domain-containing protein n=1 Tax=Ditylenchus destructor TaxID=166010 RepID=A0AAD4QUQ8_9BILA|nr:serpentine type 7TM GPCR chemoreceptor srsx domain-containing protein [Ditylenchus destructor]
MTEEYPEVSSNPYDVPQTIVNLLIVRAIVGFAGIVLNLDLVYVIYKNKNLQNSTSFLLALNAICNVLYEIEFIINAVVVTGLAFNGLQVIQAKPCTFLLLLPIFATNASVLLMLFIGLDRLIRVMFPMWFHNDNMTTWCYLAVVIGICLSYGMFIAYKCVVVSTWWSTERYVTCSVAELYVADVNKLIVKLNIIFNPMTAVCYLAVWISFKWRQKLHHVSDKSARRVFQSLSVTMLLAFFGWFLHSTYVLVLTYLLQLRFFDMWWIGACITILMAIASASFAPMLFIYSREYKKAFCRQFQNVIERIVQIISNAGNSKTSAAMYNVKYVSPKKQEAVVIS